MQVKVIGSKVIVNVKDAVGYTIHQFVMNSDEAAIKFANDLLTSEFCRVYWLGI